MDSLRCILRTGKSARWLTVLMATFVAMVLPATQTRAQLSVLPGFDLWTTAPGTTFAGAPFIGVPLGTFDFGPPVGIKATGSADTIIQRLATASVPGPVGLLPQTAAPIPIELVALQLRSAVPIDLGAGVGFYYITLQKVRGGPTSPGAMTITFANVDVPGPPQPPNGTFDSFFDVFFDVRFGALGGPIVLSDHLILSSSGNGWSHFPAPGELLINGANDRLNGADRLGDFHPFPLIETHPSGAAHQVQVTPASSVAAPEPGSIGLLLLGIGMVGARVIRRQR